MILVLILYEYTGGYVTGGQYVGFDLQRQTELIFATIKPSETLLGFAALSCQVAKTDETPVPSLIILI